MFKTKSIQPTTEASFRIAYILYVLQNSGKSADTITSINKSLKLLARNANLNKPQQVLNFTANRNVTNGTKQSLCYAYKKYCEQYQIEAQIPFYQPQAKPIKLATKEKLDIFINNASKTLTTKLTLFKETGLRPIEQHRLKVKDIDFEQKLMYPTTAKPLCLQDSTRAFLSFASWATSSSSVFFNLLERKSPCNFTMRGHLDSLILWTARSE